MADLKTICVDGTCMDNRNVQIEFVAGGQDYTGTYVFVPLSPPVKDGYDAYLAGIRNISGTTAYGLSGWYPEESGFRVIFSGISGPGRAVVDVTYIYLPR